MRGTAGSRRQTVTRASQQIAQSGYLKLRPLTARTADVALATLIESRPTRSSGTQSPNAPRGGIITPSVFCAAIPPNGGHDQAAGSRSTPCPPTVD